MRAGYRGRDRVGLRQGGTGWGVGREGELRQGGTGGGFLRCWLCVCGGWLKIQLVLMLMLMLLLLARHVSVCLLVHRELALESGVEKWGRVPALNTNERFIEDLADAVVSVLNAHIAVSSSVKAHCV